MFLSIGIIDIISPWLYYSGGTYNTTLGFFYKKLIKILGYKFLNFSWFLAYMVLNYVLNFWNPMELWVTLRVGGCLWAQWANWVTFMANVDPRWHFVEKVSAARPDFRCLALGTQHTPQGLWVQLQAENGPSQAKNLRIYDFGYSLEHSSCIAEPF